MRFRPRRAFTFVAALVGLLSASPASAAEHVAPLNVVAWSMVPFAGLLLAIAVLPLVAEHFWHSNRNKAIVASLFSVPVVVYLLFLQFAEHQPALPALGAALHEYAAFILLLGALYTVAGGVVVDLQVRPGPMTNLLILLVGAALANLVGTTGASMLLIRPFLRLNEGRRQTLHLPVFFIFLVSNLGGLLTPLGDPPLFIGFLRGVSFFWTMRLWPEWLVANGLVLAVFLVWDHIAWRRESPQVRTIEPAEPTRPALRLRGWINIALLGGVIAAVLLKSVLHQPPYEFITDGLMLLMALLSLWLTPAGLRRENAFGWHAIIEVAALFLGIFITMIPALQLLDVHGAALGLSEPWQFFWLTGLLSSCLDNAPTYLTFATLASEGHDLGWLMEHAPHLLAAISCGAVFLGAGTYIGNGPNFMVKAIADHSGFRTPSFFGYLFYSGLVLLPVCLVITLLFFRPGG